MFGLRVVLSLKNFLEFLENYKYVPWSLWSIVFYNIGIIYICKAQTTHLMDPIHHGAYFTNLMHDGIQLDGEVIGQSSPISP